MAATTNSSEEAITGINVTPLVDITLVLLIIFMVTAKIIASPALPVDLPRAKKTEEVQVVFSLVVPEQGPMLANGQPLLGDADLLVRARRELARDPRLRAVIHADGSLPHRRVMHALDLLREAGVTRIAFGALPAGEGRP